jgi:hypothetical protein
MQEFIVDGVDKRAPTIAPSALPYTPCSDTRYAETNALRLIAWMRNCLGAHIYDSIVSLIIKSTKSTDDMRFFEEFPEYVTARKKINNILFETPVSPEETPEPVHYEFIDGCCLLVRNSATITINTCSINDIPLELLYNLLNDFYGKDEK